MGKIALPIEEQIIQTLGQDQANTRGTIFTCNASTPNALGTWVSFGTLTFNISGFWLVLGPVNITAATDFLINIGIGASPIAILSNLLVTGISNGIGGWKVWIPYPLPAGTQISLQLQGSVSGATKGIYAIIQAVSLGYPLPPRIAGWDAIGYNAADSGGTDLSTYFTTANTEGNWCDLGATARDYSGFYIAIGDQQTGKTTSGLRRFFDIAIGVAPDIVILSDIYVNCTGTTQSNNAIHGPFWRPIKSGSHIYVRPQGSAVGANDIKTDVVFYGGY